MSQNNQLLTNLSQDAFVYDLTNRSALGIAGHRPPGSSTLQNIIEVQAAAVATADDTLIDSNRKTGEAAASDLDQISINKLVQGHDEDQNSLEFSTSKETEEVDFLQQILSLLRTFQELGVKEVFFNKLLNRVSQNKNEMFALLKPIIDKLSELKDSKGEKISAHLEKIWNKDRADLEKTLIQPDIHYPALTPSSATLSEAFQLNA